MSGPLILDRYRPLQTAGKGGSGVVEICWDERIQRRVAIKRLPITNTDPGQPIPGLAEARTGALLHHPAIVNVIDFEARGNEAFLIMEAIDGPSLPELIRTTLPGTLDLDIIAAIANSTADALDFAHENQVLHLDIKPENILIEQSGRIKVSDFGIAELADAQGYGQACGGTIGYMPPEQIMGEDLDQRADCFAFAMLVYHMLTGRNPYKTKSTNQSIALMQRQQIPLPSDVRDDVDEELDEVMMRALAPRREDRYETIYDLMQKLFPLLGDPKAGTAKLRAMSQDEDEPVEERRLAREVRDGIWDRFSPRTRRIAGRAAAAVLSWWVAAIGLAGMGLLSTPISFAVALVAAVLAVFFPGAGALIGLLCLSVGTIVNPSVSPLLGAGLIVVSLGWWIAVGRTSTAATNTGLAIAPLGLIHVTPLAPLLTGYTCTVGKAFFTALLQCALALVLGCCCGSDSLLHFGLQMTELSAARTSSVALVTNLSTWVSLVSWVLSAVCMSALCSRSSRVLSVVGAILAAAVMTAAQVACGFLAGNGWGLPSAGWVVSIVLAFVAMVVIGCLGAPYRDKEEG